MAMNVDIDTAAKRAADVENAAEAVHHAKLLLVDLDRRANMCREGIRTLRQQAASNTAREPVWVLCPGSLFIRASQDRASHLLEEDTKWLKDEIEKARTELKQRVVELAHLEGPDSALQKLNAGFHLSGM